jgi:phage-related tail fiber protein
LRGEFVRGWDNGRGVDPGRAFGAWQAATAFSVAYNSTQIFCTNMHNSDGPAGFSDAHRWANSPGGTQEALKTTRPRNVALLACIKY